MKLRQLGVRFREMANSKPGLATIGALEIFDVETGEAFDGICDFKAKYSLDGPVRITIDFYPAVIATIK